MGFDFTIAVVPNNTSIDRELGYIKAALLYADKVTLISPLAYLLDKLVYENKKTYDEKTVLRLINQVLPLAKQTDRDYFDSASKTIEKFDSIIRNKRYKSFPMRQKLEIRKVLKDFSIGISDLMVNMVGDLQSSELQSLIQNNQIILEKFDKSLGDTDEFVQEYFVKLAESIHNSYPLFDEQANSLMKAAVDSKVIRLNPIDKKKITHAGISENYIQRLPAFSEASVDELIDIKKELAKPLIRFRSKMIEYSGLIQTMPWDTDFQSECQLLYDKEVMPALLELEELSNDGSFKKNLGKKFFTDKGLWKSVSGLAMSVAAGGLISTYNEVISSVISSDTSMVMGATTYVASKIADAYVEYRKVQSNLERKDLYFYYEVGKRLE